MELHIKVLVEHTLSPNDYLYLYYLVNRKLCPINLKVNLNILEEKGFIKILERDKIQARQKSINIFKYEDTSKFPVQVPKESEAVNAVEHLREDAGRSIALNDVDGWIESWRNLFPRGIKTGGYPVRGTRNGCLKKMKKFVKSNPDTTLDHIFNATKRYIEERRQYKYSYMKLADYFIEKEGGSMLESYLEEDFLREKDGHIPLLDDEVTVKRLTDDI